MNLGFPTSDRFYLAGERATYPLLRLVGRLALSLPLAGSSLLCRRFAPVTRPNAPSGTSNYGFQVRT